MSKVPIILNDAEGGSHFIVLGFPGSLVGGAFPNRLWPVWTQEHDNGVRHIVCLASTEPECRYDPILAGIDWLAKVNLPSPEAIALELRSKGGADNLTVIERLVSHYPAIADIEEIKRIARLILHALIDRKGVWVHCEQGVNRTSLMLGAVLVMSGEDPDETTRKLCMVHSKMGVASSQLAVDLRYLLRHIARSK